MGQQVFSVNAVGFVNKAVPPGFSILVNPLDTGGENPISVVLPTVTEESRVFKFNAGTGSFAVNIFRTSAFGGWQDPTMTLKPGEGFFFDNADTNPNSTITFTGEVTQGSELTVPLSVGFSLVGSIVPQSGQLDTVLGLDPQEEDRFFLFDGTTYSVFIWRNSGWLGGNAPAPGIAEGFFVDSNNGTTTWTRSFSVNSGS
jgi:hypothetical protein